MFVNMRSGISGMLNFALTIQAGVEENHKREKERILTEWDKMKLLPRKRKKRVKKELIIDWSINEWSLKNGI